MPGTEAATGAGAFGAEDVAGKFKLDENGSTTGGGRTMPVILALLLGILPFGFVVANAGLPIDKGVGIDATGTATLGLEIKKVKRFHRLMLLEWITQNRSKLKIP